jgi:two-component system cell cycle response regulator DivK
MHAADDPLRRMSESTHQHVPPSGKPAPLVLLIEDYPDTREMYASHLERLGFRVEQADDGLVGHEKALELRPDVVVMDLSMPGIDGWRLTRMLKSDERTAVTPIIVITAHTLQFERQRADHAGCDGFLLKPCLPDALADEIRRVLARREQVQGDDAGA